MNVEKMIFINRAPFEHLEINFKENGINVLTAINGKGKTTIISHIVDAFHELARPVFPNSFENIENKFYRVSSNMFNLDKSKYSLVFIRFKDNADIIDYVDCRGTISKEEFEAIDSNIAVDYNSIKSSIEGNNCVKIFSNKATSEKVRNIFNNSIATYFPAYRYEQPAYLNDPYKQTYHIKQESRWSGCLPNPIEVVSGIQNLANWILDIVLDGELYKKIDTFQMPDGSTRQFNTTPETIILRNINIIISNIISSKNLGNVRFGIGKRNLSGERVSIVTQDGELVVAPNISCLSSGESSLLSVFGEILRQSDNLQINVNPSDVKGIVLIDEVEKHLHITLQKEILPKLFATFPNVQFIISSHSPFLNMGLAEHLPDRSLLIDLDNNGLSISPEENAQYKEVYNMMISENQRFADQLRLLSDSTKAVQRPIIITEGKTDWKHLKSALSFFQGQGEFLDLDVEIYEYDFDFGDSKLHKLLEQYKLLHHRYPIIGVFDCDEDNGKKIHSEGCLRKYNDNVWGISIDIPEFRKYNSSGISIEFLYPDEDIRKVDESNRRLYITSEFNENGRLKENLEIGVKNNHDVKAYVSREKEKIQCDEVIDIHGNSMALSKENFATKIYKKEPPFNKMDFRAFSSIFERIESIIKGGKV